MNMKHHLVICLWAWGTSMVLPVPLSAQELTAGQHVPCRTDSLWAYKLPYVSVTDSGRNCVWDFSNLPTDSAETISIDYYAPTSDTSRIGLHREHTNYYYHFAQDTLWLTGYENATTHVLFTKPISQMRFPFEFGDTVSGSFTGKGQYCHFLPLFIEGTYCATEDATGRLVLPDDTIDTAFRVHSMKQYQETLKKRTCIEEECYQWFSAYCRYPLFETMHITSITEKDTVSFSSSYYFPQEFAHIPTQESLQRDSISACMETLITNVTYMPNPVSTELHINYSLVRSAQVYVSLHYNGGITTCQTPIRYEEDGEHSTTVHMAGLPIGTYVVYIHADDTAVSGNIIKY